MKANLSKAERETLCDLLNGPRSRTFFPDLLMQEIKTEDCSGVIILHGSFPLHANGVLNTGGKMSADLMVI